MADKRDTLVTDGRHFVRIKDGEMQTGIVTPLESGKPGPPGSEAVTFSPTGLPGQYYVSPLYDESKTLQVEDRMGQGPPKVTSHAYRAGWDDIDWSKSDDNLPN